MTPAEREAFKRGVRFGWESMIDCHDRLIPAIAETVGALMLATGCDYVRLDEVTHEVMADVKRLRESDPDDLLLLAEAEP